MLSDNKPKLKVIILLIVEIWEVIVEIMNFKYSLNPSSLQPLVL